MQDELKAILGRNVDVIERQAVLENPNWMTKEILSTAQVFDVA